MQRMENELYFSFFMGRLLGEHLRDALTQLRRQREISKAALSKAEEMMSQYRGQVEQLRAEVAGD